MASVFGQFLQGHNYGNQLAQQGAEEKKRSQLGSLLSQAYGAPGGERQGLIQQAIAVDPAAGMTAGTAMDKRSAERLGQMASVFVSMTPKQRAQAWPGMKGELSQIVPGAQYPDAWDESLLPQAQTIAQQLGGAGSTAPAGYQEFSMLARDANLSPEDRALAARRQLYLDPRPSNAAIKYDIVTGADGVPRVVAMDPREVRAQVVGGGQTYDSGVQSPSAPRQGGDMFAGLDAIPGVQVTSGLRSPEHNARVGGVSDSYHLNNMARDVLPPSSPEQAQQIRQFAAQKGLEIIDEGDHWHLEPKSGGQGGVNPFAGRRKEDEAAAVKMAEGRAGLQLAPEQAAVDAEAARLKKAAEAGVERETNAPKVAAKAAFEVDRANRVVAAVDRALGQADWNATGLVGSAMSGVPGTDAFNLAKTVDEIKANIGFKEIQTMRDNSPTGGALGQVAVQELQMLQATLGSLDQAQTADQLKASLGRVKESMQRWAQLQQALASEQGAGPRGGDTAPSNAIDGLLGKYGIR